MVNYTTNNASLFKRRSLDYSHNSKTFERRQQYLCRRSNRHLIGQEEEDGEGGSQNPKETRFKKLERD